jgi:hypothetical protein
MRTVQKRLDEKPKSFPSCEEEEDLSEPSLLCVFMCVCVCVCMYACMYVCMYVCTYACICACQLLNQPPDFADFSI